MQKFQVQKRSASGRPTFPLLFVLAADLLQTIVNEAFRTGLLHLPIPLEIQDDFPIIQYTDDTLLVMQADSRQLLCLKGLLHTFAESTGLKVNYSKSLMVPINAPQERIQRLTSTFGCKIGTLSHIGPSSWNNQAKSTRFFSSIGQN